MNALALQLDDTAPGDTAPVPASSRPDTVGVEPFIDKFTVAARLGVHFSTVERLIKAETDALPVYRIGPGGKRQQLRFRWSEVEAWMTARREGDPGGAR